MNDIPTWLCGECGRQTVTYDAGRDMFRCHTPHCLVYGVWRMAPWDLSGTEMCLLVAYIVAVFMLVGAAANAGWDVHLDSDRLYYNRVGPE